MSEEEKKGGDWLPIIFLLVILPVAFTFGGVLFGMPVLVIGVVALGWSKRHEGPLPTNKQREK